MDPAAAATTVVDCEPWQVPPHHNAAAETRTVVLEHPIRQNYALDSDPRPEEATAALYRYRIIAAPGETVRLHVGERHRSVVTYQLTNFNDSQLTFILNQTGNSAAIKQALEPILDARRHVADLQAAREDLAGKIETLQIDEKL